MRFRRCVFLALLAVVFALALAPTRALAQDDGTSFSGSLADDTSISGLTTDFDPDGGFTQGDLHTDVSDPSHSQLLGSALSPSDFSFTSADVSANVSSSVMTDAQSAVDNSGMPGGGARNLSFAAGKSSAAASAEERQDSRQAFASGTLTASFSGGESKSAFSGLSTKLAHTEQGFSGQGIALPPATTGVGPTQTLVQTSGTEEAQGYYATDPVLTGQAETSVPSLQLGTEIPSPTMQTSGLFLEQASGTVPQYEYDDGQTPPTAASRSPLPGTILSQPPDYLPAVSGFPDSTKGMAAPPTEASNFVSSIVPVKDPEASPFPPVSDGTVFGVKTGLNPSLHNIRQKPLHGSFREYERKAQEQRILHGMSISEAQEFYQADIRQYQETGGRGERKSSLQPMPDQNQNAVTQTTFHGTIR